MLAQIAQVRDRRRSGVENQVDDGEVGHETEFVFEHLVVGFRQAEDVVGR